MRAWLFEKIFVGQMFDKTKRNLTADRMKEITAKADQEISVKARICPWTRQSRRVTGLML